MYYFRYKTLIKSWQMERRMADVSEYNQLDLFFEKNGL